MKTYYKIELRIGEWILEEDDYDEIFYEKDKNGLSGAIENKRKTFNTMQDSKDLIEELFYYSDGYVIIEDCNLDGFLTNDLIMGNINDKQISIEILKDSIENYYSEFFNEFDFVELPGKYLVKSMEQENKFAVIDFIEKINDSALQQNIEEQFKNVKKIHLMP